MKLSGESNDHILRFVQHVKLVKNSVNFMLNIFRARNGRFSEASLLYFDQNCKGDDRYLYTLPVEAME